MKQLFTDNNLNKIFPQGDTFAYDNITTYFYGEIYNEKDFAQEISSAEIAYQLFKKDVSEISKIDGKFIIIIKENDTTYIFRDHHGVFSQIYYTATAFSDSLYEISNDKGLEINNKALNSFLHIGYIPDEATAFTKIFKLKSGHVLIHKNGQNKQVEYFNNIIKPKYSSKSIEEYTEEYGSHHSEAIKRRIEGKNNIGILLSGGYDSGGNLAALRNIYSGEINSFSIGFKGDNWSELPLASCMSKTFGTNHHEYEIDGSEIAALPQIVKNLGNPFVEGGLMVNYAVMNMIGSNSPDVILGGDGSDQYFGTTGREIAIHLMLSKYGLKGVAKIAYKMLSSNAYNNGGKAYKIRFHLNKILNILAGDEFGFADFELKNLLAHSCSDTLCHSSKIDSSSFDNLFLQHAIETDLEKIINQVIIFKASRMAAMFNQNIAFPYMDNSLFYFLQNTPVQYRCKGDSLKNIAKGQCTSKFLLKNYFKPRLPKEITEKKKQGGFAPMPLFFKDDIRRKHIADYIMSSDVLGSFLKKEGVEKFIRNYETNCVGESTWFWYRQSSAIQYFNLLTLAIWWETYINRNNRNIF